MRLVDDGRGRRWAIRETVTTHADAPGPVRSLLADAGTCIRRIWNYPPDWADLESAALLELIERAPRRPSRA